MLASNSQEFSTDTRRLEPEDLSRDQFVAIREIEERLTQAKDSPAQVRRAGPASYLAFAEDRHPRVLLLDGDRGTGKTSFMLTLADRWNPPADSNASSERQKRMSDRARDEFQVEVGPAPNNIRVLDIMDFDPLPPGMPLLAAVVQAWRPLIEEYDRIHTDSNEPESSGYDDLLIDDWHRLFGMAASGWNAAGGGRSLIDQVLDREDQVRDWHEVDWHWRSFIGKVIARGVSLKNDVHRLQGEPVFVIMIDDCDLQVDRVRELLPTLRLLYHPRMFFLVAADRPHMIDMLRLDFLGQQNRLAADMPLLRSRERNRRDWAQSLAEASFEKVFPVRNRFVLQKLSLQELLKFKVGSYSFDSILSTLKQKSSKPSRFASASDYLQQMAGADDDPTELPRVWTHRTAHQIGEDVVGSSGSQAQAVPQGSDQPEGEKPEADSPSPLHVIGRLLARNEHVELVQISRGRLRFLENGKLEAYFDPTFEEDLTQSAKIVLSSQPKHRYRAQRPGNASKAELRDDAREMAAVLAVSLQDDGFPVEAPRVQWDARLSLAWTAIDLEDHDLALAWPWYRHPSPLRLLNLTKDWGDFITEVRQKTDLRPDRIAYAWIYYQLRWMGGYGLRRRLKGVLPPSKASLKKEDWQQLMEYSEVVAQDDDAGQWRVRTLPLLARPEIGLPPAVQRFLLQYVQSDDEKKWLRGQRRQLITDAIINAAESRGRSIPDDHNRAKTVDKIVSEADRRLREINSLKTTPWTEVTGDKSGPQPGVRAT